MEVLRICYFKCWINLKRENGKNGEKGLKKNIVCKSMHLNSQNKGFWK